MVKVLSVNGKIPLVDGKAISATGGGSAVELDTTLSEAGKAADAKAVGDALAGKQDKLIAGDNITIAADGKTISATGGGGAGAMVVTFTYTGTSLSADKTVEEVTAAMASMPVIGNLTIIQGETTITSHLGTCCSELLGSEFPTPAFGPFICSSAGKYSHGTVGVDKNGQWAFRSGEIA